LHRISTTDGTPEAYRNGYVASIHVDATHMADGPALAISYEGARAHDSQDQGGTQSPGSYDTYVSERQHRPVWVTSRHDDWLGGTANVTC
jgi:hypothetical protein